MLLPSRAARACCQQATAVFFLVDFASGIKTALDPPPITGFGSSAVVTNNGYECAYALAWIIAQVFALY